MKLKPKSVVGNEMALLYRRYTDIEMMSSSNNVYRTADNKYWQFNTELGAFVEYLGGNTANPLNGNGYFKYKNKYYHYNVNTGWEEVASLPQDETENLLKFPSTQKYQLNRYFYVGNFSYMLRGGVDSSDVQYIKGAITPTKTIDIRWFGDDINVDHDDLVVLDGKLWIVNTVSWDIKRMPKAFKVYYATLTSIL